MMKKKRNYRFLTILMSFMFLFFVGCDGGPSGNLGDGTPKSLDSVKVISRPGDYNFESAVGENSVYYYNLFAKEIVYDLYNVYHNSGKVFELDAEKRQPLYEGFSTTEGLTYNATGELFGTAATDQYYVFDGLRYNLEEIETTKDESGTILSQTLTFNTASAWNWTIDKSAIDYKNFFEAIGLTPSVTNNGFEIVIDFENIYGSYVSDWQDLFEVYVSTLDTINYQKFYANGQNVSQTDDTKNVYSDSPYYQSVLGKVNEADEDSVNFFQDAMEYAVYMFVMGYDYVDANGNATADAPYFDFEIVKTEGVVSGLNVTWNGEKVSITQALANAKALYEKVGGYVGITTEDSGEVNNVDQIKRFIKDKIIGEVAYGDFNKFEIAQTNYTRNAEGVTTKDDTSKQPEAIKINKNYDQLIENLVTLACKEAPIGVDAQSNKSLSLSDAYLASEITDYEGDYFFLSYDDNSDDDLFKYIPSAEYQSMILNPQVEDLGSILGDIWLAFEYYEPATGTEDRPFDDELTINVGLRYFDCDANGGKGAYTYNDSIQKTIKYGASNSFDQPDENWVYIGYSESNGDYYDLTIDTPITLGTQFKNIDAIKGTQGDNPEALTKRIDGTTDAREYFKLNSSSYGTFGTLNPDKFSVEGAGDNACDFFEIYFDVVKVKGELKNYTFKVGLVYYGMNE